MRKGQKASDVVRERMRVAHLGIGVGRKHSEETKRKIKASHRHHHRGIKLPPQQVENIRLSLIGRRHSEETKRKISASNKGKHRHWLGKKFSKETKEKMSKWQVGKVMPPSTRKKLREWNVEHPNMIFKDTSIERKIESILRKKKIAYKKQTPLCKIARVDFFLPDYKIVIQCDGCYWHGCPLCKPGKNEDRRLRGMEQDSVLESGGFKVYRFWEHEINESAEKCINRIILTKCA